MEGKRGGGERERRIEGRVGTENGRDKVECETDLLVSM